MRTKSARAILDAGLKDLISKHARLTGSKLAEELLEHWQNVRSHFVKVMPLQYKQALLVKAGLI